MLHALLAQRWLVVFRECLWLVLLLFVSQIIAIDKLFLCKSLLVLTERLLAVYWWCNLLDRGTFLSR